MTTLGCIRVMNTSYTPTPLGNTVSGLECGTAVISAEATARYKQYHPNSDAWIAVTNHHVVKNSSHVMCNFYYNLMPFEAKVYKVNHENDLALLLIAVPHHLIEEHPLEEFPIIGSPLTDVIGTRVTVIGYPLGTTCQTVTRGGIISHNVVGQNLVYESDACCNPGNSGGPLLDHEGRLLGINTAIMNSGTTVTLSKPYDTVAALFTYLKHESNAAFAVLQMDAAAEHDLRCRYTSKLSPVEVNTIWNCHDCGAGLSFGEWYTANIYKSTNHGIFEHILELVEYDPEAVNATPLVNLNSTQPQTSIGPELIVFGSYFKTTATNAQSPSLNIAYPSKGNREGVMVSEIGKHEPGLQLGDILVSINNKDLDSFGRFKKGRLPYFTEFKNNPETPCQLQIARQGEQQLMDVVYTYNRIDINNIPLIHAASLTPYEQHPPVALGGLSVTQLTADSALMFGHTKYLTAPFHNDLVFVVPTVNPASQEWIIQRIAPGSLMTHINFKPLSSYGSNDREVWKWVGEQMSADNVCCLTVSFQCKDLDGNQQSVHNVYAVDNSSLH